MPSIDFIRLLCYIILIYPDYGQSALRILNSEEANRRDFPYVVSVRRDKYHLCGGTIISDKAILTAAHCVQQNNVTVSPDRLNVRVGSTNILAGGELKAIDAVVIHPDYLDFKNNLAVLLLQSPLEWSERTSSIPFAKDITEIPTAGSEVRTAGWGKQSDNGSPVKLHSDIFVVADYEECTAAYSANDESIMCLNHELKKGSCYGDAGNGAVYGEKLVAVANFVIGACGSRYPDVYTNIVPFSSWLDDVINANKTLK